jgi:hypothetical protein
MIERRRWAIFFLFPGLPANYCGGHMNVKYHIPGGMDVPCRTVIMRNIQAIIGSDIDNWSGQPHTIALNRFYRSGQC